MLITHAKKKNAGKIMAFLKLELRRSRRWLENPSDIVWRRRISRCFHPRHLKTQPDFVLSAWISILRGITHTGARNSHSTMPIAYTSALRERCPACNRPQPTHALDKPAPVVPDCKGEHATALRQRHAISPVFGSDYQVLDQGRGVEQGADMERTVSTSSVSR